MSSTIIRPFRHLVQPITRRCIATGACPGLPPKALQTPAGLLPYLYVGQVPYTRALRLQEHLVRRRIELNHARDDDRSRAAMSDLLVLLEHPPTYTVGRRIKRQEEEGARLRALGAEYVETLRGGETTFHGPGQLVGYPILDIRNYKLSVRCYVSSLEKTIIETCAAYGVEARTTKHTGVWVDDLHKIAAIGKPAILLAYSSQYMPIALLNRYRSNEPRNIANPSGVQLQRYISSHGIALNCDTDLRWFDHIVPCGIEGKFMTSLSAQLGRDVAVSEVIGRFCDAFGEVFGRQVVELGEIEGGEDLQREIYGILQHS